MAHCLAYSRAVEALTDCIPPDRALWLRALFLERERIANHLGDLGAICNDVAFAFLLYQFHRLKEILVRTNLALFGHRFMMDKILPGGVASISMQKVLRRSSRKWTGLQRNSSGS